MSTNRRAEMEELMARLHNRLGGGQRERFTALATKIQDGDESDKYTALTELCEALNMATEDILMGMRAEVLVPPTVQCLRLEHNPELMYLAARVLTYMADSIPPTAAAIIRCQGVPLLCEKLMAITDIELAEQSISCLDRIANDHPGPVLEAGGPMALISFVDFFSIHVQRNAVSTVSKICKQVNPRNFGYVSGVLPQLRNFVQHDDERLADHAITALARIAHGVRSNGDNSMEVFGDTAPIIVEILEGQRSGARFASAVKFLVAVSEVAVVAEMLIELGLVRTIAEILAQGSGCDTSTNVAAFPASPGTPLQKPRDGEETPPRLAGTPPIVAAGTPQTNSNASRGAALSPDVVTDLTRVLKATMPPAQVDFTLYMDGLALVTHNPRRRRRPETLSRAQSGASHGTGSGSGDDEEEEEDDAEPSGDRGPRSEQRELVQRLLGARGIRIENQDRWRSCNIGRHSCDGCGKRNLAPGDWYRDNTAEDADLCQRCIVSNAGNLPDASFTDMGALLEGDQGSPDEAGDGDDDVDEAPPERKAKVTDKHEMIQRSPYLVDTAAEALDVAMSITVDVDSPQARACCVEFALRCAAVATADTARVILSSGRLGPFLIALLRRGASNPGESAAAVFIIQRLAELNVEECRNVFLRDGVLHALAAARARAPGSKPGTPSSPAAAAARDATATEEPLHVATSTAKGWAALLASRAAKLVALLSGGADRPAAKALASAAAAISEDSDLPVATRFADAVRLFNDGIALGASAFELLNSGFIESVLHYLVDRPTASAMLADAVALVGGLIEAEGTDGVVAADASSSSPLKGTSSDAACGNLLKVLRHCHAIIGQLENFSTTPTRRPIRVQISKHRSSADTAESSNPSSPTSPSSPGPMPSSGGSRRREKPKSVQVSVEPLANIAAVSDFIAQRLLQLPPPGLPGGMRDRQRSSNNPAGPEDEENVQDVLPSSSADAAAAVDGTYVPSSSTADARVAADDDDAPARASSQGGDSDTPAPPTIYVRYGNQTLAHGLSIQEVAQKFVPKDKRDDVIPLFYSTKPFGTDVKPIEKAAGRGTTPGPSYASGVLFRAAAEVHSAVTSPLAIDECTTVKDVSPALVTVMRLCRLINAVLDSRRSVSSWFDAVGSTSHPQLGSRVAAVNSAGEASAAAISSELQNAKLSSKVLRCVDGPGSITVLLDSWCIAVATDCPFFFATSTRRLLFEVVFFGTSRGLVRVLEHCKEMEIAIAAHHKNHRVPRKKLRVWRNRPLDSARAILAEHARSRAMFDIQYHGEVGSGLGPTHEFFHLVGDALHTETLGVWRADEDGTSVQGEHKAAGRIITTSGLFLRPEPAYGQPQKMPDLAAIDAAKFVGAFLARGLLDHHVVNVRLSPALLRLLRGDPLVAEDTADVSGSVSATLLALLKAHARGTGTIDIPNGAKNVAIDDLGLAFVLPGRDEVPLEPKGDEKLVTAKNAFDYVEGVARVMLCDAPCERAGALREAFDTVLPLRGLRLFTTNELSDLFCGHTAAVSAEEWARHVACDHGFTSNSPAVKMLFETLGAMSAEEQQGFIRFLTGARQLPVGGLSALRPRVTVVRKRLSDGGLAEEVQQLPSAMTCQNYLKLPAYETKQQLEAKLQQAIKEGNSAFSFT